MGKDHSDTYISLWRRGYELSAPPIEKTAVAALAAALNRSRTFAAWLTLQYLPGARLPARHEKDGSFALQDDCDSEGGYVDNTAVIDHLQAIASGGCTDVRPTIALELWVLDSLKAEPYKDMGGDGVGRVDLSVCWGLGARSVQVLVEAKVAANVANKQIENYGNLAKQTLDQPLAYALLWDCNDHAQEADLRIVGTLGTGTDYTSQWPMSWHATWFKTDQASRRARVAVAADVAWDDVRERMSSDADSAVQALVPLLPH